MRIFLRNLLYKSDYFKKWFFIGIIIGIVAGLSAITFFKTIEIFQYIFLEKTINLYLPHPFSEKSRTEFSLNYLNYLPLIMILGGFLSGFLVYKFAPETEGHGTDSAIDSFHNKAGKVRARVIPIKMLSSAITIGTGGSAGREGPTAQIAAGIGSLIADLLLLDSNDRRKMLAIGIGAGIGSIFKAPIGGAILAAEVLYRMDLETEIIFPALVASAVGYSIFGTFTNFFPLFGYYNVPFNPLRLPIYVILGIITGLLAIFYTKTFYFITKKFKQIKISNYFKPAIGAFIASLICIVFPECIGTGYGWVQMLIENKINIFPNFLHIPLFLFFLVIAISKILTTSFTIGSGGSGGVFGPGMVIGSFVGASIWTLFHPLFPNLLPPETCGAFTIVGMLSFFGGASKVPIAVTLMVIEMTGTLQLLPAAMISVAISYIISGNNSIYEKQVKNRKYSPVHFLNFLTPELRKYNISDIEESIKSDYIIEDVKDIKDYESKSEDKAFVLSDKDKHFKGILKLNGKEIKLEKNCECATLFTNLEVIKQLMINCDINFVPICSNDKLIGTITLEELINIYKKISP